MGLSVLIRKTLTQFIKWKICKMAWNKQKQLLESFISPSLIGRIEYRATSYRYAHDKSGRCYLSVDKKDIFNMSDNNKLIKWYHTAQDIKKDESFQIPITSEELEQVRKSNIPEEAVLRVARNRKMSLYADKIMKVQIDLSKSNFEKEANQFLTSSIEACIDSDNILLNVFALIDRRVGKKRLRSLKDEIGLKHPCVQYFYKIRCEVEHIELS